MSVSPDIVPDMSDESIDQLRERVKLEKEPFLIYYLAQILLQKAFAILEAQNDASSSSDEYVTSRISATGNSNTKPSSLSQSLMKRSVSSSIGDKSSISSAHSNTAPDTSSTSLSSPTSVEFSSGTFNDPQKSKTVSKKETSERFFMDPRAQKKILIKEAVHWLNLLSVKGYPEAQYLLGDCYSSGILGKIDRVKAFSYFLAAAKHGHVESSYRLACCHEEGLGCSRDASKVIKFLTNAASKNHPSAMFKLGHYIFNAQMGFPSDKNSKIKGIKWLTLATKHANNLTCAAPYELAQIYESGFSDFIISDKAYAVELYTKAAQLGHYPSCGILGELYEANDKYYGISRNPALSINYYKLGASGHDLKSMMGLCGWYLVGADDIDSKTGQPILLKNYHKAFYYAYLAAKGGDPRAQFTVSYFLQKGMGCPASEDESRKWLKQAADNGFDRAVIAWQKITEQNPELALKYQKPRQHRRHDSFGAKFLLRNASFMSQSNDSRGSDISDTNLCMKRSSTVGSLSSKRKSIMSLRNFSMGSLSTSNSDNNNDKNIAKSDNDETGETLKSVSSATSSKTFKERISSIPASLSLRRKAVV